MTVALPVAHRVQQVRDRIAAACERSHRDPADVTLVGASKSQPIERMQEAWQAGVKIFGENRVQEALAKMAVMPTEVEWHLIGPLQSNKARKVAPRFRTVHSIDRIKIAQTLSREALACQRTLQGFLEVNLGDEESKHGFSPGSMIDEVRPLAELEGLEVVGLMAIPPFDGEAENMRTWFRQLRGIRDEICARPEWDRCPGWLSMGMSDDFEIAIEEGATHIRVGTHLFGRRNHPTP